MKKIKNLLILSTILFLMMGIKINATEFKNLNTSNFVTISKNKTTLNLNESHNFLKTKPIYKLKENIFNDLKENIRKPVIIKEKIAKKIPEIKEKTNEEKQITNNVNEKIGIKLLNENININLVSKTMYVIEPLNVRTGPSTNYEICDYLSTNDEVNVIGICDNNWFQILMNNKEAFVNGNYLSDEKQTTQIEEQTTQIEEQINQETIEQDIPESKESKFLIETIGNVNANNVNIANEKLLLLPQNAINRFKNEGWHIYVTDENLAITMFGGVYSLVMGGTDYDNHFIKIENREEAVLYSTLHEFGHFVFFINNGFANQSIIDAYNTDVNNAQAIGITYGLDKVEEYYAEIFDLYIKNPEKANEYCPNLASIIQEHLNNL